MPSHAFGGRLIVNLAKERPFRSGATVDALPLATDARCRKGLIHG
jgi:hypothetical protein